MEKDIRQGLGSGLSPEKEQKWYLLLNPIWSDGNAELGDVATDPLDTSYGREDEFGMNGSMLMVTKVMANTKQKLSRRMPFLKGN